MRLRPRRERLLAAVALAILGACSRSRPETPSALPPACRGYVLISIDALRADQIGPYGARPGTTPFLDRLAGRSVVFENAFSQIPSTLPSHLTMFTGLYPAEHGVLPPSDVLPAQIPTLPERFRAGGFRTFGHSEGGYVQGGYGFARGFEEWTDTGYEHDSDIDRTFGRGLDSLRRLKPGERFFLFLHTYSVHDPYEPDEQWRKQFWPGPPPAGAFEPTGPNFAAYNSGRLSAPPGAERYYRALYDASVRQMDAALERFFAGLDELGLARDTTVFFTSDHGEEFLEHGRFVHTQAYPESLRVPLVVVPPEPGHGRRVREVVGLVDYLPTLLELARLPAPPGISGRSFAALVAGGGERVAGRAFAEEEMLDYRVRTVLLPVAGHLHQLYRARARQESDGFWVAREVTFDATGEKIAFRAVAYHRPRRVAVTIDGRPAGSFDVDTDWRATTLALPPGTKHVVRFAAEGCDVPREIGTGDDVRCLSFKLQGLDLARVELYDLAADPLAQHDLSADRPDLVRTLAREFAAYPENARFARHQTELTEEQIEQLRALGYLQ